MLNPAPTGLGPQVMMQEQFALVYNGTGASLAKGALVYPAGYDSTNGAFTVAKADADDPAKSALFVMAEDVANTRVGYAGLICVLGGLNTSAASAVGAPVYLGGTAGAWSVSAPSTGQINQVVGYVVVKSATVGKIAFFPGWQAISSLPSATLAGLTSTVAELNFLDDRTDEVVLVAETTATLAEINAGKVILPAVAGRTYTVRGLEMIVTGTFADTTGVLLQDTNTTPVVVASAAVAALTNNAVLRVGSANVAVGAGYTGALTAAKGLTIIKNGADATGGTSIFVRVLYTMA